MPNGSQAGACCGSVSQPALPVTLEQLGGVVVAAV